MFEANLDNESGLWQAVNLITGEVELEFDHYWECLEFISERESRKMTNQEAITAIMQANHITEDEACIILDAAQQQLEQCDDEDDVWGVEEVLALAMDMLPEEEIR